MISLKTLKLELHELNDEELGRWIAAALVRAEGQPGAWLFEDIDVARIRLILELRRDLEIEEESLPVVLSLLDQLYDMRRQMARVNTALANLPADIRAAMGGEPSGK